MIIGTQLKVINLSDSPRPQSIIFFQKNCANTNKDNSIIAWQVINQLSYDHYCEIDFSNKLFASVSDYYGNHKPQIKLQPGHLYKITRETNQTSFVESGLGSHPLEIQVENTLNQGSYNVNIFRSNKLLSRYSSLIPQERAFFQFKYIIWVGILPRVKEGDTLLISDIEMKTIFQQFYLIGVKKAELILVGGGIGPESTPFKFHLTNIEEF
ncbi:MAG: hypothetical protein FD167_1214 [bacterium]|nr:MAG: hypothetical protein FD167_1214 [bacterium]